MGETYRDLVENCVGAAKLLESAIRSLQTFDGLEYIPSAAEEIWEHLADALKGIEATCTSLIVARGGLSFSPRVGSSPAKERALAEAVINWLQEELDEPPRLHLVPAEDEIQA